MVQANEQGLNWGEFNPFYSNQTFKNHQPLQWFLDDQQHKVESLVKGYELFTILRNPVDRFISDLKWHIEKKPQNLKSLGFNIDDVRKDIRPFMHYVLDVLERLEPEALQTTYSRFVPFRLRRLHQKLQASRVGLTNFGYAHFIPQNYFCELGDKEIIQRYFNLDRIEELSDYLQSHGLTFISKRRENVSALHLDIPADDFERINTVLAEDIEFFNSKTSV